MAKHIGSGCEGQACLRKEGEGSATKVKSIFKKSVASSVGVILAGTIASGLYIGAMKRGSELPNRAPPAIVHVLVNEDEYVGLDDKLVIPDVDDWKGLDEARDLDEEPHLHIETPVYRHYGGPDSAYVDTGMVSSKKASMIVGEFSPVDEGKDQFIPGLIGKGIQKTIIEELDNQGVEARKLDDILQDRFYTKEDLKEDPEILYKLPAEGIVEGKYDLVEPSESESGGIEVRIGAMYASWGNGSDLASLGLKIYEISGDLSLIDKMAICLARKIVGEISSTTFHWGPTISRGRMVFVFVAFRLAVSR